MEAYTRDFGFGSLDPVPANSVNHTLTALYKPLKILRKNFSLFSIGYKLLFLLRKNFPYISMG